jgi:methionyl-tRNA formyltransferase
LDLKKNKTMMRVVFCGYRQWALEVFDYFNESNIVDVIDIIKSKKDFESRIGNYNRSNVDIVVLCGWSWIIKENILNNNLFVGIHPSDLPKYRGGSPLQHQIIDGLKRTKSSLMTISSEGVDVGDIWAKEQLSLEGDSMEEIFRNLTESSILLLKTFFKNFDNITPIKQDENKAFSRMRRKPIDSCITKEMLNNFSLEQIYDFIRALTSPYPNAYMEDQEGNKLFFEKCRYLKGDKFKG